ncbi:MAG TPA: nuclear transport factor 2 family protein [Solirubrobacteraceae bacterium]|nr:nuclear transport factor 2 family protein [Solirubrobacteraceae bacterium]
MSAPSTVAELPETIVSRWVEAFNTRDVDGMLACVSGDVDFHPLRLSGLRSSYHGHDGIREWFRGLQSMRPDCQIAVSEVRGVSEGRVLVAGALTLGGEMEVAPVCALHRIDGGLIAAAHQYLSDPDMIERLGLIP